MDIVKLAGQLATPAVLDQVAGQLGVSQGAAQKGLGAAIPGVLAGLLSASTRLGFAEVLGAALPRAAGLSDLVGSDPAAAGAQGSDLLAAPLGADAVGVLANALGSYAGLAKAGAGALLGLAGSMVLGALGKEAKNLGLGARGVLGLLDQQRNEITAALPADFAKALGATGLLAGLAPRRAPVQPRPGSPKLEPVPGPPSPARSGWTKWLVWLVLLALLAVLLLRLFASAPAPVVQAPVPAPATTAAPAPEPAAAPARPPATPAPVDTAAAPADPLVVGGIDIGASVSQALDGISAAFDGITDVASAEAALPRLTEARDALDGVDDAVSSLPETGHAALRQMITAALPGIRTAAERLKTDGPIAAVVGPVIDDILAELTAFAA